MSTCDVHLSTDRGATSVCGMERQRDGKFAHTDLAEAGLVTCGVCDKAASQLLASLPASATPIRSELPPAERTAAALERIADGTFGRCETCGGAIGRQRLLALPAARFCIHCTATAKILP